MKLLAFGLLIGALIGIAACGFLLGWAIGKALAGHL